MTKFEIRMRIITAFGIEVILYHVNACAHMAAFCQCLENLYESNGELRCWEVLRCDNIRVVA